MPQTESHRRLPLASTCIANMRALLLCAMLMVPSAFAEGASESNRVQSCNYAPYEVDTTFVVKTTNIDKARIFTLSADAGECVFLAEYIDPNTEVLAYSKPASSIQYNELSARNWYLPYWAGRVEWGGANYANAYCQKGAILRESPNKSCASDEAALLFSDNIIPDTNGIRRWAVLDHGICERVQSFDCYNTHYSDLATWAYTLSLSLEYSRAAKTNANERFVREPVALEAGFDVIDISGSFDLGVTISPKAQVTPFGTPILFEDGDLLVAFNENPVYNGWDLMRMVVEHAIDKGVTEGYTATIERNGQHYDVEAGFYFVEEQYGHRLRSGTGCTSPLTAAGLSAIRESMFYTDRIMSCIVDQNTTKNYSSQTECRFVRAHIAASYQQFCPRTHGIASWVGAWFVPFKGTIERALFSKLGLSGAALTTRLVRAGSFEGVEEALRTRIVMPVGINDQATLDTTLQGAKWGAALGVGFELATPILTKGLIK